MARRLYTFPVASHSYFRVGNQAEERQKFLKDNTYSPVFSYGKLMKEALVLERLKNVEPDSRAQVSLQLVQTSSILQQDASKEVLATFRALNQELFDEPNASYLKDLLAHIREKVTPKTKKYWDYIEAALPGEYDNLPDYAPSEEVFLHYKTYFETYSDKTLFDSAKSLPVLLQDALHKTHLNEAGWRMVLRRDASHASVHHYNKSVSVGELYTPRTHEGALRIVTHEVYGHALRGHQDTVAESEGFAILLEQLLDDRFKFRRSYRYLAAGLGWGSLGSPMTFREVYEIVWRAMVIVGIYGEKEAKANAFNECTRVFRGGRPDIAGAVYLKDSVYFEANIAMWQKLSEKLLEYNEFIEVIEGKRRILT